ncbi:hypothetical protein BKA64DRAFT_469642 [Cadophora sp. MPI-SDFR-AT-0126]|nr:hypothetical protein BKA64DRAFT_469642 [Leotiomycetes sp. MPI-SDFR-AT-0126]
MEGTRKQLGMEISKHVPSNYFVKDQEKNPVMSEDSNPKKEGPHEQASSTILLHTTQRESSHPQSVISPERKPRAGRPKVKTGCITCRTRRVKCDEAKPSCLRCQKSGRTCEGYAPEKQRGKILAQPRILTTLSIHSTEEAHQYFQIFINQFAHDIPGLLDSNLWTVLIPQASRTYSCIRYSVNALGALYKALEASRGPILKVNVVQSFEKNNHESAVGQHSMAIQSLQNHISHSASPQLRTVLLSALLFVCFETLRGCYESAAQKLVGSLKIIEECFFGQPGSKPWTTASKSYNDKFTHSEMKKIAFQEWQSTAPLASDGTITRHVKEYLERCFIQPDPDTGSQLTVQSVSHETCGEVRLPGKIAKMPGEISIDLCPDSKAATLQTLHTWPLGCSSGDHEATPYDKNQADTDESISVSSEDRVSSRLPSRRPSTTFSHSSKLTGGTHTILSTIPRLNSLPMVDISDPNGSRTFRGSETTPQPQYPQPSVPALHNTESIEDIVLQTFMRLESNEIFWGMIPQIPPIEWDIHDGGSHPIPAAPFEDIASAHLCWDFLMNRALKFYRRIRFNQRYCPSLQRAVEEVIDQQTSCLQQLNAFHTCYMPLLDRATSLDTGHINSPVVLLISVYWRLVRLLLESLLSDSEMIYDKYNIDFGYIVKTCTHLASDQSSNFVSRKALFTLEIGIIPALHFTATKCRDPLLRQEAIALMFSQKRQEGEYDGVLCARIGRWIAACEEQLSGDLIDKEPLSPSSIPRPKPIPPTLPHRQDGDDTTQPNKATQTDAGMPPEQTIKTDPRKTNHKTQIVPEENRFKLIMIEYHIMDRYLKAIIQKAVPGADGKMEKRETVIAW